MLCIQHKLPFSTTKVTIVNSPFPCGLIDSISGILYLLNDIKFNASNIVVVGDSAGGGLAIATVLAMRNMNLPKVAGVYSLSPWLDLTHSFETFDEHGDYDYIPTPHLDPRMPDRVHYYCPNSMLKLPLVSPIFEQNFQNLPPILVQSGTAERLYGEDVEFCLKGSKMGLKVTLETFHSHVHVFQMFGFAKGSVKAIEYASNWIKNVFRSPKISDENLYTKYDFNGEFMQQSILPLNGMSEPQMLINFGQ